ncbi:bifunctional folylpolyglutamate synthase/dihydrofolate synthase [Macrococcoides caseolyticum]|uniref:bifunctional folylpolyglutamate synthase/dihydrofolate synthase n=1 Tax=Macrococcoides caseolyticum TaxID=69966 RepID=UPI000C33CA12|nr:folylpolyglutamate synthase/dihydrofolate synthase family protein [Macrococcus caseolyticus]PKE13340.1 bifunctional folylpolyglutamate synthase/dihydrofolate synthase [Macrococcus caseolyticus]PKE48434.1 bifunctional folylpolyglutamate synthase/dihydrofolate synthase [Macrococcus caseolyticus]PKF15416.1 bifunctional folylpolyglutamate synthase/dihydrofolate synthase [Macrococcus caseolyticus]QQB06306.1 bifunctional folylpolyglutamate synthase/dihydrofolate synthase [Macrococcus caseolyticus]
MNYLESLYWIHERYKFGIKPGVKRMEWMLDKLDNPQHKIKGIHVVGTNGKGSTVSYLKDALIANHYEVGTFTSPYIETFNERISLNGQPISDEEIVQLVEIVKPVSEQLEVETDLGTATEFEIITMMMFVYFGAVHPVDFVIVEAGLGAKNDSTNVFTPVMSILTSIGLDHTNIIGDTYIDIAKEKAGVIKVGVPLVYAVKNEDAQEYINSVVAEKHIKGIKLDRDIQIIQKGDEFTFRYKSYELEAIELKMIGTHQQENAALAIATLLEMYDRGMLLLDFNKMIHAIEDTTWTGRIEKIQEHPTIILDGAHNLESIEVLVDTMKSHYAGHKIDVLFSAIDGKPIGRMLKSLEEISEHFYVTSFDFPKALPLDTLYEHVEHDKRIKVKDYADFIRNYEGDVLLVTGSLYFISAVKDRLRQ